MTDNHRKPPDIRMCRWPAWPLLSKTNSRWRQIRVFLYWGHWFPQFCSDDMHMFTLKGTGIPDACSKTQTMPHDQRCANPRFLHTEICAVVVLLVRVINVPGPSFPEGSGHFIQELTLCPGAQHQLPQTLLPGSWLLPQLLLITRLSGENTHQKIPFLSRSLQMHKHSHTAQQTWINPSLWENGSLSTELFLTSTPATALQAKENNYTLPWL